MTEEEEPEATLTAIERRPRGAARIERLMASAERIIVERGVGGLQLSQVAKRAQTAQGSLYQFFASRDEMLIALHERYAALLEAVAFQAETDFSALGAEAAPGDLVRLLLNPMAEFYLEHPAYQEIRRDATRGNPTKTREDLIDNLIVSVMGRMLTRLAPHLSSARRRLVSSVMLDTGDALLSRMALGEEGDNAILLIEAELMLEAYLIRVTEVPTD